METRDSLIKKLQKLPNHKIIMASDEEGNGFNSFFTVEEAWYNGENVVHENDVDQENLDRYQKVLVIWP